MSPEAHFFESPDEFRTWLESNHESADEVWVGYYKKGSGRPSMTWPESVDQALCFGWIDGRRRPVEGDSYQIRFTPRRARSHWSAVNVAKVQKLTEQGLMRPAGVKAFEARSEDNTARASYERTDTHALAPEYEERLRANAAAAEFYDSQPSWYRRAATHWVMSAKREETRSRRLATLIADSAAGRTVKPLTRVRVTVTPAPAADSPHRAP